MLGAIVGDIIGYFYEWNNVKTLDFDLFPKEVTFTDDTVMTLAVAKWLIEDKNHTDAGLVKTKQELGRKYPNAGYGRHFYDWIFSDNPHPYNSWGNGCAMRVGPIGWAFDSGHEVLEAAKVSAECTHNHIEGIKGAQATALCILLARMKVPQSSIKEAIQNRFGYNLSYTVEELRGRYSWDGMDGQGNGGTCQDSVPQAIICTLDAISYEDAIRNAISIGGDSDTIGCISGSIAEAIYGIPQQMSDIALTYLPKSLVDVIISFENKYSNKTDVANSVKFQECLHCRRANSHVCGDCQKAKHFLPNDTRKFYYINIKDAPYQGPVEAFLLPYKDVQIDSYLWTEGMNQWDFAGNVLDERSLAVDYDYCPCCNGKLERDESLPDYEPVYKCKNCGFSFDYGGTRPSSKSQMEYRKTYYNYVNPKSDNRRDYGAYLYGPLPPRMNDSLISSSEYGNTIMDGEYMRSTLYGTPAIHIPNKKQYHKVCILLVWISSLFILGLITYFALR